MTTECHTAESVDGATRRVTTWLCLLSAGHAGRCRYAADAPTPGLCGERIGSPVGPRCELGTGHHGPCRNHTATWREAWARDPREVWIRVRVAVESALVRIPDPWAERLGVLLVGPAYSVRDVLAAADAAAALREEAITARAGTRVSLAALATAWALDVRAAVLFNGASVAIPLRALSAAMSATDYAADAAGGLS